jgi:hypothetical protein
MGPYQHFAHAGLQALPSNLCFLQTTACYSFSRCTISLLLGCKHFQAIINKVTMDAQIYLAWWTYFAIAEVFFINSEIHKLYVCSLMSSQFICHVPHTLINLLLQKENKCLKQKLQLDTWFCFWDKVSQCSLGWLNLWSSCLCLLSAGITGVHTMYHTSWFLNGISLKCTLADNIWRVNFSYPHQLWLSLNTFLLISYLN